MSFRKIPIVFLAGLIGLTSAFAGKKEELSVEITVETFKESGRVAPFFEDAAGYAVFPTIGKGGIGIGGSHGKGRVYKGDKHIGDVSMTQVTIGFQFGGQAFSQIIFFEDEDALNEFISGNFEFGAQVSAVAITVGVEASASTAGSSAGASTPSSSTHAADYKQGMAVFTYAKGGLMYEASVGGQKFKFRPNKSE
jgi:lipid-binding SYLF domain-containing protein